MSQRSGEWLWSKNPISLMLYPFSFIFCGLIRIRSFLYKNKVYAAKKPPCPVIVVGNITVGGNGKTPVVLYLVELLKQLGYHPGVITRGYKSQAEATITLLDNGEQNDLVGDESNMLSECCVCPIGVGVERPATAQALVDEKSVDVIVCDDGLQHYALARDIEIVVKRDIAMGNGWCLPAGPLREPLSRLKSVDLVIDRDTYDIIESMGVAWNLADPQQTKPLADFADESVHAIAGIGFPDAFFSGLKEQGLNIKEHHFADHYDYSKLDLQFDDDLPILMTHKDAVKVRAFQLQNCWVVPLQLELSSAIKNQFINLLEAKK